MSYSDFKTPYFEIEVGKGKSLIPLSPQLMRLVEKIEIIETLGAECLSNLVFNITFREGSRELYPLSGVLPNSNVYGAQEILSNATGMLQDLTLKGSNSNSNGFKIETSGGDILPSVTALGAGLAASEAGVSFSSDFSEDVLIKNAPGTNDQPYLFSSENHIRVTWGYKESKLKTTKRSIRGKIVLVQSNFPEVGSPTLTVVCNGTDKVFEQYSPVIAKVFKTKGLGLDYEGKKIQDILDEIGSSLGIDFKVSESMIYESQNKGYADVWAAGETLLDFLRKLARRNFAYLDIRTDPSSGKVTVHLINRVDYDSQEIAEDKNLFAYKQPGSIVKSIDIKADYANPSGAVQGAVTDTGEIKKVGDSQGVTMFKIPEKSSLAAFTDEFGTALSGYLSQGNPVNHVEMTPDSTEKNMQARTTARAACMNKGIVSLEFVSLGIPALKPIIVRFDGIGKRYSGPYRIVAVTHIIDGNGYICRGTATTNVDYSIANSTSTGGPKLDPNTKAVDMFKKVSADSVGSINTTTLDETDPLASEFNTFLG